MEIARSVFPDRDEPGAKRIFADGPTNVSNRVARQGGREFLGPSGGADVGIGVAYAVTNI